MLLRELIVVAAEERGWEVSDTTLSKALAVLRLTRKKDAYRQRTRPP